MSYTYRRYYNTSGGSDANDPYIKSLEEQLKEQFDIITKQKLQINDQTVRIHQLEADLDYAKRSSNNTSNNFKARFEDLDRQYRHQTLIINQLNDQIKILKQKNFELQSEKISLQHDLSTGSTFRPKSGTEGGSKARDELIDNLKYEIKCDQKENAELRMQLERFEEKQAILETELDAKRKEIAALRSQVGRSTEEPTESLVQAQEGAKKEAEIRRASRRPTGEGMVDDDDFRILEASTFGPRDLEIQALRQELFKLRTEAEQRRELSALRGEDRYGNRLEEVIAVSGHKSVPALLEDLERILAVPQAQEQLQYFSGTIVNNRKSGYGVEIDAAGNKYSGMFRNGERHGLGKLETKEFEFTGPFEAGQFEKEKGLFKKFTQVKTLTLWEGVIYSGEVEGDKPEGRGRLNFPNGIEFTGGFASGRIHAATPGTFKVNDEMFEVSVLDLKDMGIMILNTPDKTQTWVLNTKSGHIQKS